MKIYKRIKRDLKTIAKGLMAGMLLLPLTSCEDSFLFDKEGDCEPHYYMRYVFDMNMNYADAFASKVHSVNLFVFDAETGEFVKELTETGAVLDVEPWDGGYLMPLDLKPGRYEFVAWCGLDNNKDHFTVGRDIKNKEDLICRMAREIDGEGNHSQNEMLTPLFHGTTIEVLPDNEGTYIYTTYLIKDTNNINISMQHISGLPLTKEMFTVKMVEGNGLMHYDNSLLDDNDVTYSPWTVSQGIVDAYGDVDVVGTEAPEFDPDAINFFKAELSTARLMADRDPKIVITDNETGNVVYTIPIVQWAKMLRSEQHSNMTDQEYLDREDEYNIMLYLDHKEGWKAARIFINSWRVVNNETEMGH